MDECNPNPSEGIISADSVLGEAARTVQELDNYSKARIAQEENEPPETYLLRFRLGRWRQKVRYSCVSFKRQTWLEILHLQL